MLVIIAAICAVVGSVFVVWPEGFQRIVIYWIERTSREAWSTGRVNAGFAESQSFINDLIKSPRYLVGLRIIAIIVTSISILIISLFRD